MNRNCGCAETCDLAKKLELQREKTETFTKPSLS